MGKGVMRGVALGLTLALLSAGSGCRSIPPPPQAPPSSPPSSREEASRLYALCMLDPTRAGFRQDGTEYRGEEVEPLFAGASPDARSYLDRGTERAQRARKLRAAGWAVGIGGLFIGYIGLAGSFVLGIGEALVEGNVDDSSRSASGYLVFSGLAAAAGVGLLIGSGGPSRDAEVSFRNAADAYNAGLRRRLGME
jgi:hypothetical protein